MIEQDFLNQRLAQAVESELPMTLFPGCGNYHI